MKNLEILFRVTEVNGGSIFLKNRNTFYSNLRTYRGRGRTENFFAVTNYNFHYWSLLKEPPPKGASNKTGKSTCLPLNSSTINT